MRKLIFLSGICMLLFSCKEEETAPEDVTTFPVNIGNEWEYEQVIIHRKFESETSKKVLGADTFKTNFTVTVTKDTVLAGSIAVKEFVANQTGTNLFSKEYYKSEPDGLINYAYQSPGAAVFTKKKSANSFSFTAFKLFGPISVQSELEAEDKLYFYDTPRLTLKFPLTSGQKWTYVTPVDPAFLHIEKEVIGFEKIQYSFGTFHCFKIKYHYIDSDFFNGIDWIDWVSAQGLIKRQVIHQKITYVTAEGIAEYIGQLTETLSLKGLKLK